MLNTYCEYIYYIHTHIYSSLYFPLKWELLVVMRQIKLKQYILQENLKGHVF